MIDQAWSGVIDSDGLSLSAESEPFRRLLADVRIANGVVTTVAAQAEVIGEMLTSRQSAELVGEVLSRGGYRIDMADLKIVSASGDEEVYLYVAKRADLGSFLYVGESDAEVGVGLIRDMIGVVDDQPATVRIFATTWLLALDADEHKQHVEWRLAPPDYVMLTAWLNARQGAGGGTSGA